MGEGAERERLGERWREREGERVCLSVTSEGSGGGEEEEEEGGVEGD